MTFDRRPRCQRTGKVRFATYALATEALSRCEFNRRLKHQTFRQERSVYLCDFCDDWHLTSKVRR